MTWALAALALAAAACGSGGSGVATQTVPAGQWEDAVCASLTRYAKTTTRPLLVFQGLHLQFQYGIPRQSDVRTKQVAASESIVEATDTLIAELQAAGTPATRHGKAFADELVAAVQELRDSVEDVHGQATSLPTGSSRAADDAELSPRIGAALQELGKRLNRNRTANGAGIDLRCGGS